MCGEILFPSFPIFRPCLSLSLPMNGRGGVKLATIIEQQGCEVRDDSQRVSSGDDVQEGGLGGCRGYFIQIEDSSVRLGCPRKRTNGGSTDKKGGAASAMEGGRKGDKLFSSSSSSEDRWAFPPSARLGSSGRSRSVPSQRATSGGGGDNCIRGAWEGKGGSPSCDGICRGPRKLEGRSTLAGRVAGHPGVKGPFHP